VPAPDDKMDLGSFADEVLEAVAGLCGDTVVEDFDKACNVLETLAGRPGRDRRELAAALGLTLNQLESCRQGGVKDGGNSVFDDLCHSDAVYAGNVLIQRINEAAHWREEFRDMQTAADLGEEYDCSEADAGLDNTGDDACLRGIPDTEMGGCGITADVRSRASGLLAKHLDASEGLKQRLVSRLEEEICEGHPVDKDYRHCVRSIAANLRRNPMLAASFTAGRVPPQWVVNANREALAPRLSKLGARAVRKELFTEATCEEAVNELRRLAQNVGRGTELAPPPQNEPVNIFS